MKHSLIDFSTYTGEELMESFNAEMTRRLNMIKGYDKVQGEEQLPLNVIDITPYQIMKRLQELDWREDPRKGHSDPRIDFIWDYVGYPKYTDDQSWCAGSLNFCLLLAGYEPSESIPTARSFESYGKAVKLSEARLGDILVWKRVGSSWKGHVAFLGEGYNVVPLNHLAALGGNQSNKVTVTPYPINGSLVAGGTVYELTEIRRITDMNKVREPDYKTLKELGIIA